VNAKHGFSSCGGLVVGLAIVLGLTDPIVGLSLGKLDHPVVFLSIKQEFIHSANVNPIFGVGQIIAGALVHGLILSG
jgi:hypothetical protein